MVPLLSASGMREADRYTIESLFVPDLILMEHAALGVVQALEDRFSRLLPETRGVILAGPGNNGGDALAAARILFHRGCPHLFVALFGEDAQLTPAARSQLRMLGKLSVPWGRELDPELLPSCDWVIDGLFGTGLKRPPEGPVRGAIEAVNRLANRKWVVAVDIPSGLSADTGNPYEVAVRASETVTLGFWKKGLVTGQAADFVGKVRLAPLQIPRLIPHLDADAFLYTAEDARRLPERRPAGHKGEYGHVYVFCGRPELAGAAALSSLAALRAGAGLVTLVGEPAELDQVRPRLAPEIMTAPFTPDLFKKRPGQVAVLGPGMGTDESRREALIASLRSDWSLVLDADALTLISMMGEEGQKLLRARKDRPTLLTPHPKEAGRMLDWEVTEVERDRYASCRELVERYQAYVLLKGKGTVLGGVGRPLIVVTAGDTGLSKGGSGDTLTGVLASLMAQQVPPDRAITLGAYLHGRASELLSQRYGHERSTLASELSGALPEVLRELEWAKIRQA